jgi:hypothetical protein
MERTIQRLETNIRFCGTAQILTCICGEVGEYSLFSVERRVAKDSSPSGQDRGPSKLDCFIRFDEVSYWHSRTRELIAIAETHGHPAFRKSFRDLRRESRKAEFELVIALYHFQQGMEARATDADDR